MILALLWFALLATALKEFPIYTRDLYTAHERDFGVLLYDSELHTSVFKPILTDVSIEGAFSICGRNIQETGECFAYQESSASDSGKFGGTFEVILDLEGEIVSLSFKRSAIPGVFESSVVNMTEGPHPNLEPFHKEQQKQKQTKKVLTKKIVINEEGKEVEIESESEEIVEIDNRSWVQRNWMYIVPPLVIFLFISGPEQEK